MELVDYDTLVFMHPSYVCNFSCVYCGQHCGDPRSVKTLDIGRIMQGLDRFGRTLLVSICGGEPFLIPNLIEFVQEVKRKHYVRIDSNLSLTDRCRTFLDAVGPERITEIIFSVHALEREKRGLDLMDLIVLVKEFQAKGFRMAGDYVTYPPLFSRLEKDIDLFRAHGIKVMPVLFCGEYQGRNYPFHQGSVSYSKEELDLVFRYNSLAKIVLHNPHGEYCQAGCTAFCLNDRYEVFPCLSMLIRNTNKIGDLFSGWRTAPKVIKCPMHYCADQYNKTFMCTLSQFNLAYMQLKAMRDRGVLSERESAVFLRGGWRKYLMRKTAAFLRKRSSQR
ncbi:MAG: radical SAM protein [Candidatus Omnitrophica bacterium]|nr:radical SAM protein [Candidatus Omnitrophota bacterium]